LKRKLRSYWISNPILHGQGEGDLLFPASTPLVGAKNELREGIAPIVTWADTDPLQDLILNLVLLPYKEIRYPRPTLQPPAQALVATEAGFGRAKSTLKGAAEEASGEGERFLLLVLVGSWSRYIGMPIIDYGLITGGLHQDAWAGSRLTWFSGVQDKYDIEDME
jgi:hypothetical protein